MKIAIVGRGGIGSVFALQLARAGLPRDETWERGVFTHRWQLAD